MVGVVCTAQQQNPLALSNNGGNSGGEVPESAASATATDHPEAAANGSSVVVVEPARTPHQNKASSSPSAAGEEEASESSTVSSSPGSSCSASDDNHDHESRGGSHPPLSSLLDNAHQSSVVLAFDDFAQLQTQLVLLPRVEDEGVGAVVAACMPSSASVTENVEGYVLAGMLQDSDTKGDQDWRDEDFCSILAMIRESTARPLRLRFVLPPADETAVDPSLLADCCTDSDQQEGLVAGDDANAEHEMEVPKADSVHEDASSSSSSLPSGSSLLDEDSISNKSHGTHETQSETEERCLHDDGSRGSEDQNSGRTSGEGSENQRRRELPSTRRNTTPTPTATSSSAEAPPQLQLLGNNLNRWSSWTARTAQLATEAATTASASFSSAMAAAKKEAQLRNSPPRNGSQKSSPSNSPARSSGRPPQFGIYVETTSGDFVQPGQHGNNVMTNTSWLSIRSSEPQPINADKASCYSFQWYRSRRGGNGEETTWIPLPGATHCKFQPSATEVGHRLRCVVTKDENDTDCDETSTTADENKEAVPPKAVTVCENDSIVAADNMLFNGARETLVRRHKFGGLLGQENASGRTFRLQVELSAAAGTSTRQQTAMSKTRTVSAAVSIFQVSGNTEAPMHPEPIVGVSAMVPDHADPKCFALVFPSGLPESASMVSALCTDGRFLLSASKRLARESILLSIGVANFAGSPKDLTSTQVLFDDCRINDEELPSEGLATSLPRRHSSPSCVSRNAMLPEPPVLLKRSSSLDRHIVESESGESDQSNAKVNELVSELRTLRSKLARKDKAFSELQRHVTKTDTALRKTEKALDSREEELRRCFADRESIQLSLRRAERRIETHEDTIKRQKGDHVASVSNLETKCAKQSERIVELEKSVRALENEKAVISAQVGARDSKLSKMEALQKAFDELSAKVEDQDSLRRDVEQANRSNEELRTELDKLTRSNKDCCATLEQTEQEVVDARAMLKVESEKANACKTELQTLQLKIQKVIAERNSYKQKGDSLSKEIGRVCRNGRTIREVEKILADDAARREEVHLLREQKRKALEDLQHYRTSYEQSRLAQRMAGMDNESVNMMERNLELERLLSEMTEYVNAKELQVDTLRQVNDTLQTELRDLAKASMSKNDI